MFLRNQSIAVPRALERAVMEELSTQVRGMLIKKIYGFLTISDYKDTIDPKEIKRAKARYQRLRRAKSSAQNVKTNALNCDKGGRHDRGKMGGKQSA